MTTYKARFVSAIKHTEALGLNTGGSPIPWREKMSTKKARSVLHLSRDLLYSQGMRQSSHLARNCAPIHMELQRAIAIYLNMKSYITIGDRYWSDSIYCEMTYSAIEMELANPSLGEPINAHVWLTLPDGSILDCTGEAHLDILSGRGEHPLDQCLTFIPPGREIRDGYHRPFLVGPDFLVRAGVFTPPGNRS